ncbi:hypothetical protein GCM10025782_23070 [Pedococcus ginsenosidimutans]|uniref:Uncharacterized protein n=1 Tax=Pedococcus ginsenosidimutans TaxID=490570 RepID=A0ABP8YAX0_9MICO
MTSVRVYVQDVTTGETFAVISLDATQAGGFLSAQGWDTDGVNYAQDRARDNWGTTSIADAVAVALSDFVYRQIHRPTARLLRLVDHLGGRDAQP